MGARATLAAEAAGGEQDRLPEGGDRVMSRAPWSRVGSGRGLLVRAEWIGRRVCLCHEHAPRLNPMYSTLPVWRDVPAERGGRSKVLQLLGCVAFDFGEFAASRSMGSACVV